MSKVVINTRERAVSNDFNRMQAMQSAELAETLRAMLIAKSDEASSGGVEVVESTLTSPMTAVVLSGLRAVPEIGGTGCSVTPGTLAAINPTGITGDDSTLRVVHDDGDSSLAFLANAGPGIRIDVVECSVSEVVTETDNRDIYNPATGNFTPTSVSKVKAHQLTYRIRRGTAGAGYPGHASGWLPLMVATVPTSATNWDGCVCWDVRPLKSDRVDSASEIAEHASNFTISRIGGAGTTSYLEGKATTSYKRFRAGGLAGATTFPIAIESGGADGADAEPNAVTGFASVNGIGFLYAAFPASLPRWCRYTPASSGARVPGSFRGVPVFSRTRPSDARGFPTAALSMPSASGLSGVTTTDAVMLAAANMSTDYTSRKVRAMFCDGLWTNGQSREGAGPVCAIMGTGTNTSAAFTLNDASGNYPPNAKALFVELVLAFDDGGIAIDAHTDVRASVDNGYETANTDTNEFRTAARAGHYKSANGGGGELRCVVEVPMVASYPGHTGALSRTLTFDYSISALHSAYVAGLNVLSWRV